MAGRGTGPGMAVGAAWAPGGASRPRGRLRLVVLAGRDRRQGFGRGAWIPHVDGLRAGGRPLVAPVASGITGLALDAVAGRPPARGRGRRPGHARPTRPR